MSTKFYPLQVREVRRETPDTVSIAFEIPEALRSTFRYLQGQHLVLRTSLNGEEVRRTYSICTGVEDNDLRIAVKKVPEGAFSTWANEQLRPGDTLEAMPPQGHFRVDLNAGNRGLYVAFAAGSGITPVMSLIRTTLVQEPDSRFMLFYGNRGFDHIIFREQLEELKNRYPDRLAVHHVLSRESLGSPLFQGRLDGEKCRQYGRLLFAPGEVDAFFLCGPEEMTFSVKSALESLGVSSKNIHFELFTTAGLKRKPVAARSEQDAFEAEVTVIQDGAEFNFKLPTDGSTLLDAAMRAGADLPFSCKGGVCSTCKARVLEGELEMELNYGLEADEVEAGYVLTCQSHPKTRRVVVSFDV
ncbi:MAG: 1,2-phenylacetyl-CoA epoxidase subunit PaaE [Saprospiraceae bacterium]